jgi:hypothetical protein
MLESLLRHAAALYDLASVVGDTDAVRLAGNAQLLAVGQRRLGGDDRGLLARL